MSLVSACLARSRGYDNGRLFVIKLVIMKLETLHQVVRNIFRKPQRYDKK